MYLFIILFGFFLGILSGLIPGLHSNTVISILSSVGIDSETLSLLILIIFPLHLLFSFIPSIFFGIPEQGTVLAVLPGQRMVLQGKGLTALRVVIFSSLLAALLSTAFFYPSLLIFPFLYSYIRPYLGHLLLLFSIIFLLRSKNPLLSLLIFLLAGLIGFYSLRSEMLDKFLPMFSGMFAMAAIVNYGKSEIPVQKEEALDLGFVKFVFIGVLAGFFADLLPGISSPSQVATFLTMFIPINTIGYLAAISSISISEAIFSFATSASIKKSRMGATAMLAKNISVNENLVFVLTVFLAALVLGVFLINLMRKNIAKLASFDFSIFNKFLVLYLVSIIFVLDGFSGIIIFALSTILGVATVRLGVERTNLMGAVILPTILLLFKIFF